MKVFRLASFLCLTLTSTSQWAQCDPKGCTSTIETIYTQANGVTYVGTPDDENLANCEAAEGGVYFTLDHGDQNSTTIYSGLLSAYMAGERVRLRIIEGSNGCKLIYVRLDARY